MSRRNLVTNIENSLQIFATSSYLFQQAIAEQLGLHPTDFHCLHILDQEGALTAGKLATKLGLTSGATTAVIDRLSNAGYVKRTYSDKDRRSIIVSLHQANIAKMRILYKPIKKQVAMSLRKFSDSELQTISKFFKQITEVKG